MRLAAILLALIAVTHYGHDPLASLYSDQQAASRALFYAFRGLEGLALFFAVGVLSRRTDVALVCLWGCIEEGQTAVCRVAAGIGSPVSAPAFSGLCGAEMYWVGIAAAALLAWFVAREKKS